MEHLTNRMQMGSPVSRVEGHRLRRSVFLLVFIGVVSWTRAGEAGGQSEPTPQVPTASPLLVLLAAEDEASIATERQLVAELRLTLDGVPVEQIAIEKGDFLSITLPEQLEVVQPLIQRFLAKAAVWVTSGGTSGHLIQFVVSESGSATIRTVEAGSPEELALAIRELLDSTYLIDIGTRKKEESRKTEPRLSLAPLVGLNGGMAGYKGGSLYGGIGLEVRYRFTKGFFGGLTFVGKLGPRVVKDDGIVLGWRIEPGGFLAYLFRIGRFGIGPYLQLSALRSTMNMVLGESDYQTDDWWAFRGALGLELFLKISDYFFIVLDWTIGGITKNKEFERDSTQSVVLATPLIDYSFTLGFSTIVF